MLATKKIKKKLHTLLDNLTELSTIAYCFTYTSTVYLQSSPSTVITHAPS